jgi:hypothetical protein
MKPETNSTGAGGNLRVNHTPGPWIFTEKASSPNLIIWDGLSRLVAEVHCHEAMRDADTRGGSPHRSDTAKANAALIAAAPELYEVCQALSRIEASTKGKGLLDLSTVDLRDAYNLARAALAKAEGRAQ